MTVVHRRLLVGLVVAVLAVPVVGVGLASAGDTGSNRATTVHSLYYCRGAHGTMRAVSSSAYCTSAETKYHLTGMAGPRGATGAPGARGPAGAAGAPGSTGPAGADGARGPSDAYFASAASTVIDDAGASTITSTTVPAGSYLVSFTAYANSASTALTVLCQVSASSGSWTAQPTTLTSLPNDSTISASLAGSGAITVGASTTLTLRCAISPLDSGGDTASVLKAALTALQVGTLH